VRSALTWLGESDPVGSLETSRREDPEREALLTMLQEWRRAFGVGPENARTLRDVVAYCDENRGSFYGGSKDYRHPEMRAAVLAVMPVFHRLAPDAGALGRWLRAHKGRLADGLMFDRVPETGSTPTRWWLDDVTAATTA
jgi:hypothetical protein